MLLENCAHFNGLDYLPLFNWAETRLEHNLTITYAKLHLMSEFGLKPFLAREVVRLSGLGGRHD